MVAHHTIGGCDLNPGDLLVQVRLVDQKKNHVEAY